MAVAIALKHDEMVQYFRVSAVAVLLMTGQFFNTLVLAVQSFMKSRSLQAMDSASKETVVKIAQDCELVLLIVPRIAAGKKFHPATA
jgi:hypothetical protein